MFTITPLPRSIIDGSTALEHRKTLFRTTDTSRSHVTSSIRSTSSPSAIAALLTSTATGPSRASASPTMELTSRAWLTSARIATASPPALAISVVTAPAVSASQSTTATFAPSPANRCAMTRPMPEPAPVTMTTLSLNRIRPGSLSAAPAASLSKDAVLGEHLADVRPLAQDVAHRVLAGHLFECAGDDVVLDRRRHDDAAIVVSDHEVAVRHRNASDRHRAADRHDLEPPLRVGRRQPGREHRELHLDDPPAVAAHAVEHDAPRALRARVSAQQLAPERSARLAFHCAHHDLAGVQPVEQVHQELVRLGRQFADLDGQHRRGPAGNFGAGVKGT